MKSLQITVDDGTKPYTVDVVARDDGNGWMVGLIPEAQEEYVHCGCVNSVLGFVRDLLKEDLR